MRTLCFAALLLSGCAGSVPSGGVPVQRAYDSSLGGFDLAVRHDPSPLSARPFVPVYYPADIFPVYVPSRISRRRDILVGEPVVYPASILAAVHQPSLLQDRHVFGNRRWCQLKKFNDLADAKLLLFQGRHDSDAAFIRQGLDNRHQLAHGSAPIFRHMSK